MLDKTEQKISATRLIGRISRVMEQHNNVLEGLRLQRQESQNRDRLRQEQEAQFQAALARDRERERAASAEQERIEMEQQQAAAEASRLEEEMRVKEAERQRKRESLPAEPAKGKDTTNLRLNLPNGKRVQRRFDKACSLQQVKDYVELTCYDQGLELCNFALATNFPKRTYSADEDTLSLEEAGLHPQAVIFIQDLDA